jgi:hypothetical protein
VCTLTVCRTIVVFHEFYHLSDSRFLYLHPPQ